VSAIFPVKTTEAVPPINVSDNSKPIPSPASGTASFPTPGACLVIRVICGFHFQQGIPIFAGLDSAALLSIADAVQENVVQADSVIVREGEPGDRMFIVRTGRVQVVKHLGKPTQTLLAVFGPRDFMGEMSIIECVARSASLRAIEETSLFALRGIDLYHLFKRRPDQYGIVILNIARDLSRRLRALDEKFSAVSH
jgi:CRP/FNR family transcriptional regulator, cyclic AMP receptor protein